MESSAGLSTISIAFNLSGINSKIVYNFLVDAPPRNAYVALHETADSQ
jgi:hypothetical protein